MNCQRETSSFYSQWTYSYVSKLIKKGYGSELSMEDYPKVESADESFQLSEKLLEAWDSYAGASQGKRLLKSLWSVFGQKYLIVGLWYFIETIFKIGEALVLGHLLRWFDDGQASGTMEYGFLLAGLLSIMALGHSIVHHIEFFMAMRVGMQVRVSLIALIYRICLDVPLSSLTSSGVIINVISNDVQRFEDVAPFLHFLWLGPLELVVITYLIYLQIGWSAFLAVASLIMFIPLQSYFGKMFGGIRKSSVFYRDERIKTLSDMITGIMLVKLYAWEEPFLQKLSEIRKKELSFIKKASLIRAVNDTAFFTSSVIISVFAFVSYTVGGGTLTAEKVFVTLVLLQPVRLDMTNFFPKAVTWSSECIVSLKRIETMLGLKRMEKQLPVVDLKDGETHLVDIKNASFRWERQDLRSVRKSLVGKGDIALEETTARVVLTDISMTVKKNQLIGVCGPVGAGKSSLLYAILREISPFVGVAKVSVNSIAYASQSPWIQAGSIKDNIIFGSAYDDEWFCKVVTACNLDKDLENMQFRENTVIGERGVTLSGGQKARLALARAVYQNADLYLLDDPLSAVDPKVGKSLFYECICGILKGKAIVLVTHHLKYLKDCDHVILIEDGKIRSQGSYSFVVSNASDSEFVKVMGPSSEEIIETTETFETRSASLYQSESLDVSQDTEPNSSDERPVLGTIKGSIYYKYLKAGLHASFLLFLVVTLIAGEGLLIASVFWLSKWTQLPAYLQKTSNPTYMTVFMILAGATVIISSVRAVWFYLICLRSSRIMFENMCKCVFRAPMSFFHDNPHGRILNRFAKDLNIVDETLPLTFFDFLQCFFMILGSFIITVVILPYAVILYPLLLIAFMYLRSRYVHTSRQIKRVESLTRSPIYSMINSTLEGLSTIRAFSSRERFTQRFVAIQNEHTRIFFTYLSTSRWLGFRLDMIAFSLVCVSAFLCVFLKTQLNLSGGIIGLIFSYLLENVGLIQWAVRQSTEVENNMISVERILEYMGLPSEASSTTTTSKCESGVPDAWPTDGEIQVKGLSVSYRENSEPILCDISCDIKGGEKVGIVGRTGAGKSTLLHVFFRLIEPKLKDCIFIDGISTTGLDLFDLRSRLSIIPQEPFCFKGTLRFNLDPTDKYQDDEIWHSLEIVGLKEKLQYLPLKLESAIEENGSNWSLGERQLICLARAILRKPKILFMDEATSNVDMRTDSIIQKSIRDKIGGPFHKATVLTIAHRLKTVIDYDKIIVLDKGRIVEYGKPSDLLAKSPNHDESAWFARMASSEQANHF